MTMLTALDATALAGRVRSRELASRQLIEATLERIDELDPKLNAYRIVLADEARAEADRLDRLSDGDLAALPLAGVPVAIKDDTDVAGQVTMWGSAVDRGMCTADAEVVARLRRAGAIIIGKTNVPELTLWPWTASERWGVTRNPWNLDRTPGGSSGGSAAAVCTGMAAMALGSDGGGSVRYPAGLTGLVGVKPQRERVPLGTEHASGWHGLIALGPLTRSVRDAALFLEVAAGGDLSGVVRDVAEASPARLRLVVSTNPPPGSQAPWAGIRSKMPPGYSPISATTSSEPTSTMGWLHSGTRRSDCSGESSTMSTRCRNETASRPALGRSHDSAPCSLLDHSAGRSSVNSD